MKVKSYGFFKNGFEFVEEDGSKHFSMFHAIVWIKVEKDKFVVFSIDGGESTLTLESDEKALEVYEELRKILAYA